MDFDFPVAFGVFQHYGYDVEQSYCGRHSGAREFVGNFWRKGANKRIKRSSLLIREYPLIWSQISRIVLMKLVLKFVQISDTYYAQR